MENTNRLLFNPSKTFIKDGKEYVLRVEVSLNDDCKNGHHDFSVTGSVTSKDGYETGGCIHEIILEHFPKLKPIVNLHMCNFLGQPMYPVANGIYWAKKGPSKVREYLRVTEEEAAVLFLAAEDKELFKYRLFKLGIVDRWKKEADEAIRLLESLTGGKWVNPYPDDKVRGVLRLDPEEERTAREKAESGYYDEDKVRERAEAKKKAAIEKKRAEIIEHCRSKCKELEDERDICLYIFDSGLPVDNVIYYDHRKTVVFNWLEYNDKITREQFDNFMANLDRSRLPKGVEFQFGK